MMELRLISYNGRPTPTSGTASVGPAGCTFGRGADNTLVIQDPDRLVSRNQGRIEPSGTGSGFLLTNVSNANTILLNDREIGPGEHAEVAPGDQIIVGRFALGLFESLDGTAPSPIPPTAAMTPAAPVVPPAADPVVPTAAAPVVSTVDPLAAFDVDLGNASDPFADLLGPAVLPPTPAPAIPKQHVSTPPPPAPIQPAVAQPKPAPMKPVPASATDLFAGLDAPAGDPLPADLGFDAPGLSAASDHWALNTNPVELAKPFNPASFIPEDFNPFELPSLASRNTDDPLASLNAGSPITGLEELMKSQDSSPENLLENLPKPSAEPLADNQIHSNGLLGGIGQADPLALFGEESPFSMLDEKKTEVSSMRDNTAEIASAFQMPSIARPAAAQAADDPLADIVASALPPPGTPGHEAIPAPSRQTPSRPVPPKAAPPRPVKPPPPSPEAAKPPAGSDRSAVPAGAPVPSRQTPPLAPSSASQATSTEHLMAAFFSGAGMSEQPAQALTPEFMRLLGELLATATQGAVDLMQARAATKHELRAEVTMIAPQANNPLKFAPDGQAAMAQLVGKRFAGFMPPTEAMRDAFNDLRAHQVGMTAGMRAALLEVLLRFAPEKLEQRMTQHSLLDSVMPSARKSRLWDLYTDMYQQIKNEAADEFHALCGEAFLRSYDEEVKRLSTRGEQ